MTISITLEGYLRPLLAVSVGVVLRVAKAIEITKRTPKEPTALDLIYRRLHPCRMLVLPISDATLVNNALSEESRKFRDETMRFLTRQS
jgi:hypothetical protein